LYGRLGGPQSWSGRGGEEKNSQLLSVSLPKWYNSRNSESKHSDFNKKKKKKKNFWRIHKTRIASRKWNSVFWCSMEFTEITNGKICT
jgi:hypothetical protein